MVTPFWLAGECCGTACTVNCSKVVLVCYGTARKVSGVVVAPMWLVVGMLW